MGMKANFKQAVKELLEPPVKKGPEPQTSEQKQEAPPVQAQAAPKHVQDTKVPVKESVQEKPAPKVETIPPTIIAKGTVIRGPVYAAGDLELWGELQGDVESKGSLKLCGKLEGKATGVSISLCGARMQGDIYVKGAVHVDESSVILGNLNAQSLIMNGRIKGDITVVDALHLDARAIVCGNITAQKLVMAEGAVLQGTVTITADNMDQAFQEPVKVG